MGGEAEKTQTHVVVTVLGTDRTGIVAAVATSLASCGANIDDIRQNVLEGIFSMTMLVTLDEEVATFDEVQRSLEEAGRGLGVEVRVQREDVFTYMYSV